jgi:hypothetical protein
VAKRPDPTGYDPSGAGVSTCNFAVLARSDEHRRRRNYARTSAKELTKENRGTESPRFRGNDRCTGAQRGLNTAISLRFERRIVA